MNVCLISQEYPPETNWGGIATYTKLLAIQLASLSNKVAVISLAEGEESVTVDNGVTIHRVCRKPREKYSEKCLNELKVQDHFLLNFGKRVQEKIQELHDIEAFDVIEAPDTCAQALFTFATIKGPLKITRLHTPFFLIRHFNGIPDTEDHLLRDLLEEKQFLLSDIITSPTNALAEVVKAKWGYKSIQVIPNFISTSHLNENPGLYLKELDGKAYLLYFGRLQYLKGVTFLADALPEILEQNSFLQFVFVGNDSVYDTVSMKELIRSKLDHYIDRIVFIDNISREFLVPIIRNAKLVVLPSLWENFPYACIESMLLGKPVIATNVGGFPEIIEHGKEGFLCAPGDPTALKEVIQLALADKDLNSIGESARNKALTFDSAIVVREMLNCYSSSGSKPMTHSDNTRIAYILRHIPVPSETFIINEIIALQTLGLEIHPISLLPAQRCHEALMSQVNEKILDLANKETQDAAAASPHFQTATLLAKTYKIPSPLGSQATLVADYVQQQGISHLHAHFATESAWVALIASKITGVPFSFTAHAYDIFMRDRNIINEESLEERLKILVGEAARAFTISEHNKAYMVSCTESSFAEKIQIIRCGIDPERFTLIERDAKPNVTFLSVGRFVEKKGFDYLLRSFKIVADALDNVRLRIVGEGHLQRATVALADDLCLSEKIDFLGAVSSDVVLQEMLNADVFALHSVTANNGDKEGIPVSIMEASATGLPIASTRHSGISELVINGVTGLLSDERDVEAFANCMIALAASPELRERMGKAGHDHVIKNFNQGKEAEKLSNEFRRLALTSVAVPPAEDSVDIIMPTYTPNLVYLKRAILSIINQRFSNWKLYLVQDGNDCDVQAVVDEINDDRIAYFERPHQGKPEALNFALAKGESRYIAYLDDDDIWYPNHLQEAISYMMRTGAQFVHTDSHEIFISTEGDRFEEISRRSLNKGIITNKTLWYISHINAVHERQLLEKSGCYDSAMPFFIDWDMFQRLAKYAKPHHLSIYTCEHYMYLNKEKKESNTISSAHKKDPELSKRMHLKMFERSFDLLSAADFAEFVRDWQSKTSQLDEKHAEVRKLQKLLDNAESKMEATIAIKMAEKDKLIEEKDNRINGLLNSLSWKISAPLRWGFEKLLNFKR